MCVASQFVPISEFQGFNTGTKDILILRVVLSSSSKVWSELKQWENYENADFHVWGWRLKRACFNNKKGPLFNRIPTHNFTQCLTGNEVNERKWWDLFLIKRRGLISEGFSWTWHIRKGGGREKFTEMTVQTFRSRWMAKCGQRVKWQAEDRQRKTPWKLS